MGLSLASGNLGTAPTISEILKYPIKYLNKERKKKGEPSNRKIKNFKLMILNWVSIISGIMSVSYFQANSYLVICMSFL